MAEKTRIPPETGPALALAVVESSPAPLVLLDGDFRVVAASGSFFDAFRIQPADAVGRPLLGLRAANGTCPS